MKKVISLMICLLMCFSFNVTTSAKTVSAIIVQPYYEKAKAASSELYINGSSGISDESGILQLDDSMYYEHCGTICAENDELCVNALRDPYDEYRSVFKYDMSAVNTAAPLPYVNYPCSICSFVCVNPNSAHLEETLAYVERLTSYLPQKRELCFR